MKRPIREKSHPQIPAAKTPQNGKRNTPEIEIGKIKDRIVQSLSPERIYLFGSFAEGRATEESDIDIFIVVQDEPQNLLDLTVQAYRAIRPVRTRAVDIIVGTKDRFESRKNRAGIESEVAEKGILLYAR